MANSLFGWDIIVKSVESDLKTKEDILVCFTHFVLVSNGFKCIGLGESKTLDGNETKSEALPAGWTEVPSLRYVYEGRLYILKTTKIDNGLMINLLRIDERTTSLVQFNSTSVQSTRGSIEQMMPKYSEMADLIKKELIEKVVISTKNKTSGTQTSTDSTSAAPRSERFPDRPGARPLPNFNDPTGGIPAFGPLNVGHDDLNPLGIGGPNRIFPTPMGGFGSGGMLFQPPTGSRYPQGPSFGLPPGAVPPGARFDPFRPPDVDRFPPRRPNRPDNDELPPPGYDDMFM